MIIKRSNTNLKQFFPAVARMHLQSAWFMMIRIRALASESRSFQRNEGEAMLARGRTGCDRFGACAGTASKMVEDLSDWVRFQPKIILYYIRERRLSARHCTFQIYNIAIFGRSAQGLSAAMWCFPLFVGPSISIENMLFVCFACNYIWEKTMRNQYSFLSSIV